MFSVTKNYAKKVAIRFGEGGINELLRRQNIAGMSSHTRALEGGAIGCLGGQAMPDAGNTLFFTGVPIHGPNIADIKDAEDAQRLLPQYEGAFAGFFWDNDLRMLVIVTDCLGVQPLYIQHSRDQLTVVSDTKAVVGEPDLAAWGAFISIGHPIGERSLVNNVRRVPPASIITYNCANGQMTTRRYWSWPSPSDAWRGYDFLESLTADIEAYAANGDPGTVLLSGGFDSRLLLFLIKHARIPSDALIVAHEDEHDDADGRFAEQIAAIARVRYRKAVPPSDFFSSSKYLDYLNASDAGYPSLDLFIAKVASQIDSSAVWDGLAPGFAFMPLHQPKGGFRAYQHQEIRDLDSEIWCAAKILFKPEFLDAMFEGFSADLSAEISKLPQDKYGVAQFVIENRSRNRASLNPLKVFANFTDAYTPGLSKDFVTHAAMIPFREKQHGRLYRDMLARLDKRSLAIPFLSGGELLRAKQISPTLAREQLRIAARNFQARYPSLFRGTQTRHPSHSTFLGRHLFEDDDACIDPRARDKLQSVNRDNYLAWKLLFHWKAWRWVHQGRLNKILEPHSVESKN